MNERAAPLRAGYMKDEWHVLPMRIYWEDTDAAGIVYYANYLRFMERGRSEMLRLFGVDQRRLRDEDDVMFAVRDCRISYLRPGRLDDDIEVHTRVVSVGAATLDAEQVVRRPVDASSEILVSTEVRLACINTEGRPRRVPAMVREVLSSMVAAGEGNPSAMRK